MKRFLLSLFAVVISSTAIFAQSNDYPISRISFTKDSYALGRIKEGKVEVIEFSFLNPSKFPLIIFDIYGSCECIKVTEPQQTIDPGKKGVIKVTFNSEGMTGQVYETIQVKSNADKSLVRLKIEGYVDPK